jgi:hypothetical protein
VSHFVNSLSSKGFMVVSGTGPTVEFAQILRNEELLCPAEPQGIRVLRHEKPSRTGVRDLEAQVAMARLRAATARTTQERLHFAGMADYWESMLSEAKASAPD